MPTYFIKKRIRLQTYAHTFYNTAYELESMHVLYNRMLYENFVPHTIVKYAAYEFKYVCTKLFSEYHQEGIMPILFLIRHTK